MSLKMISYRRPEFSLYHISRNYFLIEVISCFLQLCVMVIGLSSCFIFILTNVLTIICQCSQQIPIVPVRCSSHIALLLSDQIDPHFLVDSMNCWNRTTSQRHLWLAYKIYNSCNFITFFWYIFFGFTQQHQVIL